MTSEQMTVAGPSELTQEIKKSERYESATRNQWKKFTDPTVDCHAAPNDQDSQRNCEKHVTGCRDPRNGERLRLFPMLRPRRDHKWQPMCRDGSVWERDGKTTHGNCCENEGVHYSDITISAWPACFFSLLNRTTRVTEPASETWS